MPIRRRFGIFALGCLLALPAPRLLAEATGLAANDPTAQAAVSDSARLGALMYRYDQAAWHATDRMLPGLTQEITPLMRGYIVVPGDAGALDTVFFGEVEGQLVEMARYADCGDEVNAGGWLEAPQPLSADSLLMVAARDTALDHAAKQQFGLCAAGDPNIVVLPPDEHDVISVYILTPPQEVEAYPLGGHYLVRVGPGGDVVESRAFLHSCIELRHGRTAMRDDGAEPEMQVVTHSLDDWPTEIHAFASRYFPIPLLVVTVENRAIWSVINGDIEYLQQVQEEGPPGGISS